MAGERKRRQDGQGDASEDDERDHFGPGLQDAAETDEEAGRLEESDFEDAVDAEDAEDALDAQTMEEAESSGENSVLTQLLLSSSIHVGSTEAEQPGSEPNGGSQASAQPGSSSHGAFSVLGRRQRRAHSTGLFELPSSMMPPESELSQAYAEDLEALAAGEGAGEEAQGLSLTELETGGSSLAEIVATDRFRRRIARDYQRFLTTFTDENGHSVYHARIKAMCAANRESLEVSYQHLVEANAFLARLVANVPAATLEIFDEATMRIVLRLFEDYDRIRGEIHVRITDLPFTDQLRDLRHNHLNTLVRVAGVVTRRSGVFPQLKLVRYDCGRCGAVLGPFLQDAHEEARISACAECEARGPFTVNAAQTVYRNYQRVTLQEAPGSVPAGRLPRHKEVVLLWDLIDAARPGELVEVTGVYRNNFCYALNAANGFPVFATVIEANHVARREDQLAALRLTDDDQRAIRRLAEDPRIGARIIRSIAPSIYGHHDIKTALALSLFGGQPKNVHGKHPLRGDINVLLLGDPGTAKSQFLRYVAQVAPRAVFATGQGASAVGLTASVRKDPVTREWTLEGGALVLADKGVCLIDEFDKMNDADRTSIHEAMEQQSISCSKAGIVTTLQARCAVIAAANPLRGRYNPALPFALNVHLTEPILSRFDVLCVVRDTVDPVADEKLARFVVGSHARSHPGRAASTDLDDLVLHSLQLADELQGGLGVGVGTGSGTGSTDTGTGSGTGSNGTSTDAGSHATSTETGSHATGAIEPIPQDLLRKYLIYAKTRIRPELSQLDVDKIARLYADLRRESMHSGSIPITVRHIESIVRMSEAHARMHLRDHVRADDIDLAIRVALESFISAQKYSVTNHLKRAFARYISYRKDTSELLYFCLQELVRERIRYHAALHGHDRLPPSIAIDASDLELRARELSIFDLRPFYASPLFSANGFSLDATRNAILKSL